MDPNARRQIVERLQEATNVLVTVRTNPSVDQLAACIGFTLWLNRLGKHATAVFSGEVPSTLEFLQPEATLEKNTDSLRDFIIALDKAKADKLRYKVEDKVVKIFITPYRASLSQEDVQFSQGDFNVEVVIGLGVIERDDLDKAIIAHGRILHDATVISVNTQNQGNIGSINWIDPAASSLSEMMLSLGKELSPEPVDSQISTALLTGIVAETARFSNDKTSPQTMQLASELMASGANQQLIVTHLEKPAPVKEAADKVEKSKPAQGIKINHDDAKDAPKTEAKPDRAQPPKRDKNPSPPPRNANTADRNGKRQGTSMILDPPALGGKLTANSEPDHLRLDPSTDPLSSNGQKGMILNRSGSQTPPAKTFSLPPLDKSALAADQTKPANPTIDDIIKPTDAPAVNPPAADAAREAVDAAIEAAGSPPLEPIVALGSQPVEVTEQVGKAPAEPALNFEETPVKDPKPADKSRPAPAAAPFAAPTDKKLPPPPPVPPPLMPLSALPKTK